MALQLRPSFLTETFQRLTFHDFGSVDSLSTASTPSSPSSPPLDAYDVELIQTADKEEVLEFLRAFFIRDEPLNFSLKLLEDRSRCPELEEFCTKDLGSGLNLKAVSNGKIIGLCLNGILTRECPDEDDDPSCADKKFEKILYLLTHVAAESKVFAQFPDVEKALTVKILSVDSSWRGRGIAKDLMHKSRDLARGLGCGLMTVDCTSHFTAKAVKRLGFDCIYSLNYSDYKVNGEVVFAPEKPHEAVTVYSQRVLL